MKTKLFVFLSIFMLVASSLPIASNFSNDLSSVNVASAQCDPSTEDCDGDGLIGSAADACPFEAGPASNNGCPLPDADGDGVPDDSDSCPREAGTAANNGCPETGGGDSGTGSGDNGDNNGSDGNDDSGAPSFTPAFIPQDGRCSITPNNADGTNVREFPELNANVVGVLQAGQLYAVQFFATVGNETWAKVAQPNGYVFTGVVTVGGLCRNIPTLEVDPNAQADTGDPTASPYAPELPLLACEYNDDELYPCFVPVLFQFEQPLDILYCFNDPDVVSDEDTCVPLSQASSQIPTFDIDNLLFCATDDAGNALCTPILQGGVFVAAGDVNGDGVALAQVGRGRSRARAKVDSLLTAQLVICVPNDDGSSTCGTTNPNGGMDWAPCFVTSEMLWDCGEPGSTAAPANSGLELDILACTPFEDEDDWLCNGLENVIFEMDPENPTDWDPCFVVSDLWDCTEPGADTGDPTASPYAPELPLLACPYNDDEILPCVPVEPLAAAYIKFDGVDGESQAPANQPPLDIVACSPFEDDDDWLCDPIGVAEANTLPETMDDLLMCWETEDHNIECYGGVDPEPIALLLPAVQAAREAARSGNTPAFGDFPLAACPFNDDFFIGCEPLEPVQFNPYAPDPFDILLCWEDEVEEQKCIPIQLGDEHEITYDIAAGV